ncbi:MAG: integrase [Alphaproteobacteria bacterium]|nr:integrase [Alphaproteobacteria bacterium]
MSVMLAEVYDALTEAGASQDKARKAAEAVAGYENRFGKIENDLTGIRGELNLLRWMVGFNLALSAAVLLKLFSP